jgi:tetratricopeptide (TPR) repeat protein
VQAAASLLGVSRYLKNIEQMQPGTQSTAAFTAFQQAETLMNEPNDKGLEAAIEKYKEAVDLDPQYALALARLGIAYGHLYGIRGDPGALELARGNCERALTLEPNLVDGHLALALLLEETGDEQGALDEIAKVLKLDPANPRALVWQGQIYSRLNRWAEAERAFQEALRERPNSWLVYNELGVLLHEQGKFQDAVKALRSAALATPRSAMAWSNLGVEYLQVGEFTEATNSLQKSLDLDPNFDQASQNMSLALRYEHKFAEALTFARRAIELNPGDDINWLEVGECYTSLGNHANDAREGYLRAAKEAQHHLQTDATDGQTWMRLALYRVKSGNSHDALAFVRKAESLGADDMDSQLYKARIMELLGDRDQALATLANCFSKGATGLQIAQFPDMQALRKDPRYRQMQSKSVSAETGAPDKAKGI